MSNPMSTPGAFSWVELMTTDPEAARKFYGPLFGWSVEQAKGFHDYRIIKLNGQMVGGMMAMPDGTPPGTPPSWGNYVTVATVDETCQKAKSLGGKVLFGPQEIPTVGRFAVLQDPQGATIMTMQWAQM
ncbi:MAG: putative glyoxylase CFP32 [Phycisphaerae bacterium]|nr:putative glyoxylase CFP32 [Phycisphaerae bacterium]